MTAMTDYLEQKLVDHVLLTTAFTNIGNFLGLGTATPTDAGSLAAEVTTVGSGYGRETLAAKMGAAHATTGRATLTGLITFGPATTDWGTISHLHTHDEVGSGAGHMLLHGAADETQTTPVGESYQLTAGQFAIEFS